MGRLARSNASHAARCVARHGVGSHAGRAVFHARRVEGRAPATLVALSELEVGVPRIQWTASPHAEGDANVHEAEHRESSVDV
jgi:hypothetical protein